MQKIKSFYTLIFIIVLVLINTYCLINFLTNATHCRHFRLNTTNSLPYFLFITSPIKNIEREMYVSFAHPYSHLDLFKQIIGVPGDRIEIHNQHLFINEKDYGYIYQISPSGVLLTHIDEGIIPKGYLFVHASHPQSFDSRYAEFGLIAKEALKERLWPIF